MSAETVLSVSVRLNGETRQFPPGTTLARIVEELRLPGERLAIEYNRFIVKRELWSTTTVSPGAEIEIVQFVGGG